MSIYLQMKQEILAELEARLPFLIAEEVAREFDRREKATTPRTKRGSAKVEETPPDDEPMTDF